MELVNKNINELIPYVNNTRTHTEEQVNQVASSIKEFGFTNPVLIDEYGGIIAGHCRTQAAKLLKLKEVPCIVLSGLTEAQKKAYVIADNRLALNAGWDEQLLKIELEHLKGLDFDLDLLGFEVGEIEKLLGSLNENEEIEEDEAPEVDETKEPYSKLGDIWLLGRHRLMCGDSTDKETVERLMNGQKADVLFTDPPYNINFKPQRGTHEIIKNDNMIDVDFIEFLEKVFKRAYENMKDDTYAFIWTGWSKLGAFEKTIGNNFKIQAFHIWVKNNFGIGYYSRPKHEPFYLALKGKPIYPQKAPSDVWEFQKVHKTIHSCEKPVGLIVEILDVYHKNSLVLDLFGGSGSTLIACEQTNRVNHSMELDEKYVDVIVKRYHNLGKEDIKLIREGQEYSWEEIKENFM